MTDTLPGITSDDVRTRRYRDLQSRWRETVLGLPPGHDHSGRAVDSLLPVDAPPDAQWLTRHIADYVAARLPEAQQEKEAIELDRLHRNLLSSQPLCFNLFGQLARYPVAAARVLSHVLARPVEEVGRVLVEHAPRTAKERLGDRSAFDAYVEVWGPEGRSFIAVETKYTDSFSAERFARESYDSLTADPAGWFLPGVGAELERSATNQLWRTVMLAQATQQSEEAGDGVVVVLSTAVDPHARDAVDGVRRWLHQPERRLVHATYESIVQAARLEPDLRAWAGLFDARYLDI